MIQLRDSSGLPGASRCTPSYPALTELALLAAANPEIAQRVLHDPIAAASAHRHYRVALNETERTALCEIVAQGPQTIDDFFRLLANWVDAQQQNATLTGAER